MTVVKELSKYSLDLVGIQIRLDRGGTDPADEYCNTNGTVFQKFLCNPSTDFMAAHWLLHLKYSKHLMSMVISNSSLSMTEVFISHRIQEALNGK
jgi:hypothetical protein